MNRTLAAVLLVFGILLAPRTLDLVTRRSEPAPAGLQLPISEFGAYLASSLDRPLSRATFTGAELRAEDQLTILYFDLDGSLSWLRPERAYLASRCTPLEELVPLGMGGGIISGDVANDVELRHLRSGAQPPCPAARRLNSSAAASGK